MSFYYGVTDWSGIGSYKFVGLKNFGTLFKNGTLTNSMKNTFMYAGFSVIYGNILALILAMILDAKLKLKKLFRTVFYMPTLFSTVVVGFIWGYVYAPYYGMISEVFNLVGLAKYSPNLLANPYTALIATAFVEKWKSVGVMTIIYLAGLQNVSQDAIESGQIDGCSGWQIIKNIKVPLLFNTITVNVILGLISGLKAFDYIFILTGGGPGTSTTTLMFSVYKMAFVENQYGMAEALAAISFMLILIISFIVLKIMNKKEIEV
jgi:raffinose/stachyose/melibiose transport system permease protein